MKTVINHCIRKQVAHFKYLQYYISFEYVTTQTNRRNSNQYVE